MPKTMRCPFFHFYRGQRVVCDHGHVQLVGKKGFNEFTDRYCASFCGWESCTLAYVASRAYEEKELEHGKEETKRQAQR